MNNKETLQSYNNKLIQNNEDLQTVIDMINNLPEAGEGGTPEIKPRYIHLIKDGVEQVATTGGYTLASIYGGTGINKVFQGDGFLGVVSYIWSTWTMTFANKFDLTEYPLLYIEYAYPKTTTPYAKANVVFGVYRVDTKQEYLLINKTGVKDRTIDVLDFSQDGAVEQLQVRFGNSFDSGSDYTEYPIQIFNLYLGNPNANVQDKMVEINENGTTLITPSEGYRALNSVEIVTNVSSSGDTTIGDSLISGMLSEYASDNLTSIRDYAFYYNSTFAAITAPNVKSIGKYAFYKTTYLQTTTIPSVTSIREQAFYNSAVNEINVPVLTTLGDKAFYGCSLLTTFNAPLIETLGSNTFQNCSKLQTVHIPNIKSIGIYCFSNCSELASIDLHNCTEINNYAFQSCNALAALILRSSTLCTLGVYVFSSTSPIALGTGYIYVPSALLEDYKTATNWSDYASQFKAIEELPDTDV